MLKTLKNTAVLIAFMVIPLLAKAQQIDRAEDGVKINENGLLVWKSDGQEATFFGVNYSTPFAYAYRAHKRMGVDLEEAIKNDVYHMARMGVGAFRVHVWDTEISDVDGNLLENEHLRLFDFLVAELKKRNIRTLITPIAFWGNGYPEPDEDTPGFSHFYGRSRLTTDPDAVLAQERYLKQFFEHINPYTGMTYQEDPAIIAVEINNEPEHSGPKKGVTDYINKLYEAIKQTGFDKPIFYNISQGPSFADAIAKSQVDGFSFQWYPSGLVSGRTLNENYLPHINEYSIPFDTIPEFLNKPKMVYEFDAADILKPYMYPAMARSFRQAGFQWATQFAYDPLHIAHTNTEYQTHYLNLVYTPQKAISMLIAARAFNTLPIHKDYGDFPENNSFEGFELSFEKGSSEMNTEEEFYFTGNTDAEPLNTVKLKHIAGVGSSPVVEYNGLGSYFLDKIEKGVWRLEVYPDAIQIRDPFAKTSPERAVTLLEWGKHKMKISLASIGEDFKIKPLNEGNSFQPEVKAGQFEISPGSYLITNKEIELLDLGNVFIRNIGLGEFMAPKLETGKIVAFHVAPEEISLSEGFKVEANVTGEHDGVTINYRSMNSRIKNLQMEKVSPYKYEATIPKVDLNPGNLNYWIKVNTKSGTVLFPQEVNENDLDWYDEYPEGYQTFVAGTNSDILLFDPAKNQSIQTFPNYDPGFRTGLNAGRQTGELLLGMYVINPSGNGEFGFQYSIKDKLMSRSGDSDHFSSILIEARVSGKKSQKIKVGISDKNGASWYASVELDDELQQFSIPVSTLRREEALLLPRPFPGFMPLRLDEIHNETSIDWSGIEKLQISFEQSEAEKQKDISYQVEVGKILLELN